MQCQNCKILLCRASHVRLNISVTVLLIVRSDISLHILHNSKNIIFYRRNKHFYEHLANYTFVKYFAYMSRYLSFLHIGEDGRIKMHAKLLIDHTTPSSSRVVPHVLGAIVMHWGKKKLSGTMRWLMKVEELFAWFGQWQVNGWQGKIPSWYLQIFPLI